MPKASAVTTPNDELVVMTWRDESRTEEQPGYTRPALGRPALGSANLQALKLWGFRPGELPQLLAALGHV